MVVRKLDPGPDGRVLLAADDSPTERYGRQVEGAGVHHDPTPGPAGGQWLYGHNWVTLAWLATQPMWGVIALPLRSLLYVRAVDLAKRAAHPQGWQSISYQCRGHEVPRFYKTFMATSRLVGGVIRVVIVRFDDGWAAYFCSNPTAEVRAILEAVAAR